MITAAMLSLIEESGEGVLVLADGLQAPEFLRSRLTRSEVQRLLRTIADTLDGLPPEVRSAMPEIDWAGWRVTADTMAQPGPAADEAAWFAVRSLVPATLSWLRVYRRSEPALFAFRA